MLVVCFLCSYGSIEPVERSGCGRYKRGQGGCRNSESCARVRLIKLIFDVYFSFLYFKTLYPVVADKTNVLYPNKTNSIRSSGLQSLQRIINEKLERNKKEKTTEHVEDWTLFSEKLFRQSIRNIYHKVLISFRSTFFE